MKIPLSEHLKTLGNREELVGLKVFDEEKEERCIFKDLTYGVYNTWALVDFGDAELYVDFRNLSIDLSEQEQ